MIRVSGKFVLAPGQCIICPSNGPGVDLERDIGHLNDRFVDGQLQICDKCIDELARVKGGTTAELALRAELDELRADRDAALERAEEAEGDREALAGAYEVIERVTGRAAKTAPKSRQRKQPVSA